MQPRNPQQKRKLLNNKKAASPAISTIIMTAATIVLVLVAMGYSNDFLGKRMAENEFSANRQFMLTTGLQIDDIAWTIGRTQTVRYTSSYGSMTFESLALNYTFEVYDGSNFIPVTFEGVTGITTGMIMFNMPVSMYTLGNNYFERLISTNTSFIQQGPSAPIVNVYCIEKMPMRDGSYVRIVAVPTIRMLNPSITSLGTPTNYYKFYLPTLIRGNLTDLQLSQSITLTGMDINKQIRNEISKVRINITFPNGMPLSTAGFDLDFFQLEPKLDAYTCSKTIDLQEGSVVELYLGKIKVSVGKV